MPVDKSSVPREQKQGVRWTGTDVLCAELVPGADLQIEEEGSQGESFPWPRSHVASCLLIQEAQILTVGHLWSRVLVWQAIDRHIFVTPSGPNSGAAQVGMTAVPASQPAIRVAGS